MKLPIVDTEQLVLLRREGAIAVLTLNNPTRRNALSLAMREVLYKHLLLLEGDATCRVIVLHGATEHFCAGGDISEMQRRSVVEGRMRMDLPTRIFKLLVTGPKPYIVAVEGQAMGAGLSLVAASDFAVAAKNAQFSCAFMRVGLIPDVGGIWSLPRKLGYRRAMELCALAEPFSAEQAREWGLINRTCEPGEALTAALSVAERFAVHSPEAMALLKHALYAGADSLDQAVNTEVSAQGLLMSTDAYAEAVDAFNQKRSPGFKSKS